MEIVVFALLLITGVIIYNHIYRKKLYEKIDWLESWKIEIMNRPVTDELSKIKQLNMTGQAEELFERWRESWDEIVASRLPDVEEKLFDIEEHIDRYRYKKAKETLFQTEQMLRKIETDIQTILHELQELMGSEEKNRIEIEELRELYRQTKKSILAHRHAFGKAEARLEKKVEELQEKFRAFEEQTKSGNYLAAREIVLLLKKELEELSQMIEQIPELLTECQTVIPAQFEEILGGYQEMVEKGYILDHIQVEKEIDEKKQKLAEYVTMIYELEVAAAKQGITEIKEETETLCDLLEKEVIAYHYVKQHMNGIEQQLHTLSNDTKQTKEETLFVQQSYQLSDQDLERSRQLEKQINQLQTRFILLRTKSEEEPLAFSIIKEELEELANQIEAIKEQHQQFREMLQTLRKDELIAREKLNNMKKKMSEAIRLIKRSRLPGLPESYKVQLDEARDCLTKVALRLEEKPLNMELVNQTLEEASLLVQRAYDRTVEMLEQAYLVEKVIQYGNRYRSRYIAVTVGLEEAEYSFRNFEYELALEQAVAAIEQVEPGAFQRIQQLLSEEKESNKE